MHLPVRRMHATHLKHGTHLDKLNIVVFYKMSYPPPSFAAWAASHAAPSAPGPPPPASAQAYPPPSYPPPPPPYSAPHYPPPPGPPPHYPPPPAPLSDAQKWAIGEGQDDIRKGKPRKDLPDWAKPDWAKPPLHPPPPGPPPPPPFHAAPPPSPHYYVRRSNDYPIFVAFPTDDVQRYLEYKFKKPNPPLPEVGVIPGTTVNGYWWNFPYNGDYNGGSLVGVVGEANNELMKPYEPPIKKSNTFGNAVDDFNAYGGAKNKKKHTKRRRKASRRKASRRKASRRKASRSRRGGTSQMYYVPEKVPD